VTEIETDPADAYLVVIKMMRSDPEMIANTWRRHRRSQFGSCTGCWSTRGVAEFEDCQYRRWARIALSQLSLAQQRRYAEPP
jgi:hypothetical protein